MPLFFFISGYLFSFTSNKEWRVFAGKRFRQLIVSYIAINAATYLSWLFVGRHFGVDSGETIPAWSPLIAALTGHGEKMVHDVPLWFLLCLFIIEISYYVIFRGKTARQRRACITVLAAVAIINYLYNPVLLPFSIGTALHGILFYAVGNELRRSKCVGCLNKGRGLLIDVVVVCLCLVVTIAIAYANGRINMHKNYYGNILLFYLGGFSGIVMMFAFCRIVAKWLRESKAMSVVRTISNNTLYICGFHLLTFSLVKAVLVYVFGYDLSNLSDTIIANFFFSIIALAVCTCGICLTRRYF